MPSLVLPADTCRHHTAAQEEKHQAEGFAARLWALKLFFPPECLVLRFKFKFMILL